jgi:hypothetical protein
MRRRDRTAALHGLLAVTTMMFGTVTGAVAASGPAGAAPKPPVPKPATPVAPAPPRDRVADPDKTLGSGWRTAGDRAVTTSSDDTGLHVLVADRSDAYRWRTAATLAEPGLETDEWIGQLCVTGSGRRAVVVYAPRQFSNRVELLGAGAYAAVVDLTTGAVTKLAERTTLAYFNPGCGVGESAVLSRIDSDDTRATTELSIVDATTGVVRSVRANGELTSALPVGRRIVAAAGGALVDVADTGKTTILAATTGTPYRLVADGPDGVAFQLPRGKNTVFARYAAGRVSTVGTAPTGTVRLRPASGGSVFLVGPHATGLKRAAVSTWHAADAAPDSDVSTAGQLLVTSALTHREAAAGTGLGADGLPDRVHIAAHLVGGADLTFDTTPTTVAPGSRAAPGGNGSAVPRTVTPATPDYSTVPSDPDRACAVPRNDPTLQAYQPDPTQVEWAADLAVHKQLTFSRPAGWLNDGLPSFSPQGLFQPVDLDGGGTVPAQILLGILAQESNLRQASWHVVTGSSGNPLTSVGFYGLDPNNPDPNKIDWSKVDCGYGVAQVTTGMLKSDTGIALSDLQQKTVALDYATNIAAGLRLLQQKWNQTRAAGIIANNGDPRYIENWFFAVWAYNTGLHAQAPGEPQTPWGLGWLNNPANPIYPADRQPFLTAPLNTPTHHDDIAYDNAKHPSDWSYPERIMGWAHTSAILPNYVDGTWGATYAPGNWRDDHTFVTDQPDRFAFCVPSLNNCDQNVTHKSTDPAYADQPPGPCTKDDLTMCWWHSPRQWVDCPKNCGIERLSYTSVEPRPYATNVHPEKCTLDGLPSNAMVVDDISTTTPLGPDGCLPTTGGGQVVPSGGHFGLKFGSTSFGGATIYPSKVDFHQVGGGYGGHFWFAHTQSTSAPSSLTVTGTWTPKSRINAWTRVLVHVPDHGAWSQQARYVVHTGTGTRERYLPTNRQANNWIELGTYQFGGTGVQNLQLNNVTQDGRGRDDIAWDAAAFVPLAGKPHHFVVAIGDSYESGEGVGNYYPETDVNYADYTWNACRRSRNAWPRKVVLPGSSKSTGALSDSLDPSMDFQFVACSGATATTMTDTSMPGYWTQPLGLENLHENGDGQFGEHAQVDSGVLSADTTLVLLSAGGNDADFPNWLYTCGPGPGCNTPPNRTSMQNDIGYAQNNVTNLITEVHSRAPNAKIILVGYPKLFAVSHTDACELLQFDGGEMDLLNDMANYMKSQQAGTVSTIRAGGTDVSFVDMVAGFKDHGLCHYYPPQPVGSPPPPMIPEDLNGITTGPTGPGDFEPIQGMDVQQCWGWTFYLCVSRSSFHPKDTGAVTYANAVTKAVAASGYH